MTVAELRKLLEAYPDDMPLTRGMYSGAVVVTPGDFSVTSGVARPDGWVMEAHETMSAGNKAKEQKFLHILGN